MANILLVDDDAVLLRLVSDCLRSAQHVVETAGSGTAALELLSKGSGYEVIVLDVDMPVLSGFEVCRRYRDAGGASKILMLTGKTATDDKVVGLEAGADDYLTKPFDSRELLARVRALLRRADTLIPDQVAFGNLELTPKRFLAVRAGQAMQLTPKQYALLELFVKNPDQVFSAEDLLDRVWATEAETSAETIRTYIQKLREKLGTQPGTPQIVSRKGVGYVLTLDERA